MTTKSLVNLYPQLTPEERLPLILSALLREDHVEADRLRSSAPTVCWRVANYHGLLDGIHNAFFTHVVDCLDLAAWMMRLHHHLAGILDKSGILDVAGLSDEVEVDAEVIWFFNLSRIYSLLLMNRCEAWRQFCTAKKIDAQAYLRLIPASRTIEHAEGVAKETACTVAEADAWLQKEGGEGSQVKRIESYLDELHQVCALLVDKWSV